MIKGQGSIIKPRPLPVWYWSGLTMRPRMNSCEVEMKINISKKQAEALDPAKREEAELTIHTLLNPLYLSNFYVVRCNLENPQKGGNGKSLFFGTIIIRGHLTLQEMQERSWSSHILALRTNIRKYVVEITGVKFSRVRVLRGKDRKKQRVLHLQN